VPLGFRESRTALCQGRSIQEQAGYPPSTCTTPSICGFSTGGNSQGEERLSCLATRMICQRRLKIPHFAGRKFPVPEASVQCRKLVPALPPFPHAGACSLGSNRHWDVDGNVYPSSEVPPKSELLLTQRFEIEAHSGVRRFPCVSTSGPPRLEKRLSIDNKQHGVFVGLFLAIETTQYSF